MTVDTRPIALISNVVNNYDKDPFCRDLEFIRDPGNWIRKGFELMEKYDRAGIIMLQGHERGTTYFSGSCRTPVEGDLETVEALAEVATARRSRGQQTILYAGGRVTPPGSRNGTGYPIIDINDARTQDFLRREWAPWIDAGITGFWLDAYCGFMENGRTARAALGFNVSVGAEALPMRLVDGRYLLDMAALVKLPHIASLPFMRFFNPDRSWSVDNKIVEVNLWYNDWEYMYHGDPIHGYDFLFSDELIIADLRQYEEAGFIVGGMSAHDAITDWILQGPARRRARMSTPTPTEYALRSIDALVQDLDIRVGGYPFRHEGTSRMFGVPNPTTLTLE